MNEHSTENANWLHTADGRLTVVACSSGIHFMTISNNNSLCSVSEPVNATSELFSSLTGTQSVLRFITKTRCTSLLILSHEIQIQIDQYKSSTAKMHTTQSKNTQTLVHSDI